MTDSTATVLPKQWEDSYAQKRARTIGLTDRENHVGDGRFLLEPSYDGKDDSRINYVHYDNGTPITYRLKANTNKF